MLDINVKTLTRQVLKMEIESYLDARPYMIKKMKQQVYLVYIRNGGSLVATIVEQSLAKQGVNVFLGGVTCRRGSTRIKTKPGLISYAIRKVVKWMPYGILNFFRNMEHLYLLVGNSDRTILDCQIDWAVLNDADYVLIVDDAVDSGYSLAHVYQYIQEGSDNKTIETFSVTVTRKKPIILPTYSIFNTVLIRFPWSMDFKK